jgi:hypothetical protein
MKEERYATIKAGEKTLQAMRASMEEVVQKSKSELKVYYLL